MKCGIYQIRNLVDGKVYIGSSCDLRLRFWQHRYYLDKGVHRSSHLQHAWNKYGKNSFVFEVMEFCPEEDLLKREQWHLDGRKSYDPEIGYNLARVAGAASKGMKMPREAVERSAAKRRGRKHTEAAKELMSLSKRGKPRSLEHRKTQSLSLGGAPFFAYKLDGTFVGEFFFVSQAAAALAMSEVSVGRVLRGARFQVSGYLFEYTKNGRRSPEEIREKVSKYKRPKVRRDFDQYLEKSAPLVATDSSGAETKFRSIRFVASLMGVSKSTIGRHLRNSKPFRGLVFRYDTKDLKVVSISARAS